MSKKLVIFAQEILKAALHMSIPSPYDSDSTIQSFVDKISESLQGLGNVYMGNLEEYRAILRGVVMPMPREALANFLHIFGTIKPENANAAAQVLQDYGFVQVPESRIAWKHTRYKNLVAIFNRLSGQIGVFLVRNSEQSLVNKVNKFGIPVRHYPTVH